jgi:hypothetical protein
MVKPTTDKSITIHCSTKMHSFCNNSETSPVQGHEARALAMYNHDAPDRMHAASAVSTNETNLRCSGALFWRICASSQGSSRGARRIYFWNTA